MFETMDLINEKKKKLVLLIEKNNNSNAEIFDLWKKYIDIKMERLNNTFDKFINIVENINKNHERNNESESESNQDLNNNNNGDTPNLIQILLLKELVDNPN